jgi:hypothetical protein
VEHRAISTVTSIVVAAAIALILRFWEGSSRTTRTTALTAGEQMTAIYGPKSEPPPPDADHSFGQAVDEAQKDYARLTYAHDFSWTVDLTGSVIWRCSCKPSEAHNSMTANAHILKEIRKARGPVRPPQKK